MSKKNFISYGDGETLFSQIAYMFSHLITGHRIKDNSGNAMTARDVLKVDGYLETTDDSTNAQTVISDAPNDITWEQYLAKTASEKQGKKWLIHDVPGICAKINAEMLSLLWKNPNPTASFAAQSITLASNDYDLLLTIYIWTLSSPNKLSTIVRKNENNGFVLSVGLPSSNGSRNMARYASFTSSKIINFTDAADSVGASASTTNNNRCIPIAIYGLKTTLDGTMFVMAKDLGTSADKCMLSDGETSVEDRIDPHALGTYIDISSYASGNAYVCPSDGYVRLSISNNGKGHMVIGGYVLAGTESTVSHMVWSVFVRKGTEAYMRVGTNATLLFFPMVKSV